MIGRRRQIAEHRPSPGPPRRSRSVPVLPAVLLLAGGAGYLAGGVDFGGIVRSVEAASGGDDLGGIVQTVGSAKSCDIKGNVSIETGERIYHVPGQPDYGRTKITPRYGERWFCSEEEARLAGWRRAGN